MSVLRKTVTEEIKDIKEEIKDKRARQRKHFVNVLNKSFPINNYFKCK